MVHGRQHDDPALEAARFQPADELEEGDRAVILVAVIACHHHSQLERNRQPLDSPTARAPVHVEPDVAEAAAHDPSRTLARPDADRRNAPRRLVADFNYARPALTCSHRPGSPRELDPRGRYRL